MTANRPSRVDYWRRRPPVAAGVLMALAAAAFAIMSIVHFGVGIPVGFTTINDSFPGAAPPEAVIAAVEAIGATAVLTRRTKNRGIALGTTSFALLGTVLGLTITLNSTRTGDVAYHVSILAALLIILGLLLVPGRPDVESVRDVRTDVRSSS
jgi:MFS family permease